MADSILEKRKCVDQKVRRALEVIESHPDLFRMQGSVQESWRQYQDQRTGPYFRLVFRQAGRQRSIYLGTKSDDIVFLRRVLHELQSETRMVRTVARTRKATRQALRRARADLNEHLQGIGLFMKGGEVRGWESSDLGTSTHRDGKKSP
jgi:hypothetical protein